MPVVSDYSALLSGSTWNGAAVSGRPVFLTFSFETAAQPYLASAYSAEFLGSFAPLAGGEQVAARAALDMWAQASGVQVFEVPAGQGDIRFAKYDFRFAPTAGLQASSGFSGFPGVSVFGTSIQDSLGGGDVFLPRASTATPYILLHEVGHALGLKHPFEGNIILAGAVDDTAHTVMSYTNRGGAADSLGPLDLDAVRVLYGGPGADGTQVASWSWDPVGHVLTQAGAGGADTILGVGVRDVISGGPGADVLAGMNGDDQIFGGDGADALFGSFGADTLEGGDGEDTLQGGDGDNVLRGGAGADSLSVSGGLPIIDGGEGDDRLLVGGTGLAQLLDLAAAAAAGGLVSVEAISITGGIGADTILGSGQAETISGGGGADLIRGGGGDDVINALRGAAVIDGGDGVDTVTLTLSTGNGGPVSFNASELTSGGATLVNVERIAYLGGFSADTLTGGELGESLSGQGGDDRVFGGGGADTVSGGGGTNYLRGDEGADSIIGGEGFDDINGNMGDDTCSSGGGDDWVVGGKDNDSLTGSAGANLVYGNLGADTCEGGAGADIVRGGQDNDVVSGGAGNDFVSGDRGDDTMSGGTGADLFHSFVGAGLDRVLDFSVAEGDRVMLDPGATFTLRQDGADTIVDLGGLDQVILVGVSMASLTAGSVFVG